MNSMSPLEAANLLLREGNGSIPTGPHTCTIKPSSPTYDREAFEALRHASWGDLPLLAAGGPNNGICPGDCSTRCVLALLARRLLQ